MGKTRSGVYHDIKESEYAVSDGKLYMFFSSPTTIKKFMNGYEENRKKMDEKYEKLMSDGVTINQDILFDLMLYKKIEKRGFYCILNGKEINEEEFKDYARQVIETDKSPIYQGVFLVNGNKDLLESESAGEGDEPK